VTQAPFEQACPAGQALPQLPQCFALVCSTTHRPEQLLVLGGQLVVQVPPTHTCPELQAIPQAPQLPGWLVRSAQVLPHSVRPLAHVLVDGKSMVLGSEPLDDLHAERTTNSPKIASLRGFIVA
jgi:hypothetical protein